jgi:hypothetical protein
LSHTLHARRTDNVHPGRQEIAIDVDAPTRVPHTAVGVLEVQTPLQRQAHCQSRLDPGRGGGFGGQHIEFRLIQLQRCSDRQAQGFLEAIQLGLQALARVDHAVARAKLVLARLVQLYIR